MKKLIRIYFCIGLACISLIGNAQDVHFSHMEFSPMTLNPGLAGANGPLQGIVNYRSQWNSVADPYKTIAASFDARFNDKKRNKSGIIAGGINFYNDQAGDLKVNTNNVNLNLAYHLILDKSSTLGLGIYSGFGQRSISPEGGKWASQYDGNAYNPSLSSGEVFNSPSFSFFDAGAGLVYTYKNGAGYMNQNKQRFFNGGIAFYHVNRPNYSYINNGEEKLYMRISGFVNANIGIANTRGSILPGIYYQRQKSAQEIYVGANYKYNLHEGSRHTGFTRPMALYIGLFGRVKDALVGKLMFEYDQFSAGFAYDINISSLTEVSRSKGGFELFLRFNMGDGGGFRAKI
ncbi:MAG: PorP/SprF family type IX secretion system membrane protein [Crocinitomicaceae bacterium]|nr:PorP/SprF family type IX secretion system membrane protein [Crocinitomicaceae bacterium]